MMYPWELNERVRPVVVEGVPMCSVECQSLRGKVCEVTHMTAYCHCAPAIRLLMEAAAPTEPPPSHRRIRIAVAQTAERAVAIGDTKYPDHENLNDAERDLDANPGEHVETLWVEADIPLPRTVVVRGRVRDE